jgi:hypothetical protein
MRRSDPPHTSQVLGPSSVIEWMTSMVLPQSRHW